MEIYQKNIEEILIQFATKQEKGLTQREAESRLEKHGSNALPTKKATSLIIILFRQLLNPLMFILLIAALASILIGESKDALVVAIAVVLNALLGFFQEWKAEKAALALQSFEVHYCLVKRDGHVHTIPAQKLVIGDIVILTAGARVPADIRLTHVSDCSIQEALLTGESKPIQKNTAVIQTHVAVGDRANMAFSGTYILSGKAEGVVIATGKKTELGKIAQLVIQTKEEATPLQFQIKKFSWVLGGLLLAIVAVIACIGFFKNMPLHELLTISIALAVAAIPEGLLIAVTSILAIGMYRMLKRKALVRHLIAAETLGSVSVVCTDKTGTLTEGTMRVVRIITKDHDLDLSQGKFSEDLLTTQVQEILEAGVCNNDAEILQKTEMPVGHPTESALLSVARLAKITIDATRKKFKRNQEIPFSSAIKYMATVHKTDGQEWLIAKGAPEKIFTMCKENHSTQTFKNLTEVMANQGLRVLAIAHKTGPHFDIHKDLNNLDCMGLIGIQDPLRPEAQETVKQLTDAGIHVVIVTGDHKETALHIAQGVGLPTNKENVLTGQELDAISDEQLTQHIKDIHVFARVDPAHKIRIVHAWQQQGQSVAMTGDGVNDAPALKAADIGVALGAGSDIAHETSDMVLLDNNLESIKYAVHEGRTIFDNIRKVIVYLLADSFSEIVLIGGALLAGMPLPFLAAQIFWINLVTDGFPNLALTLEPAEPHLMQEPPRPKNEPILNSYMKMIIFTIGIITDIGLFALFFLLYSYSHLDLTHIRTIMFTAIAIDSLFYVFSVRSMRSSLFRTNPFSNRWLLIAVVAGLLVQLAAVYIPSMQILLSTVSLGLFEWSIILGLALVKIVAIEITKEIYIAMKKP
ncbi:MAG: HAD-IC family P-type ATPase [bacterium]